MTTPRRTLKRYEGLNHARYLTCSCYHRLQLFANDSIKDAVVEHLAFVQRAMGFDLYAWVIMPEHIHLLLRPTVQATPHTPPSGMVCGTRVGATQTVTENLRRLKAPFGRRIIERWRELDAPILCRIMDHREKPRFWQPGGGYDRNIFTDDELLEKILYIHNNPVRRELAELATNYRWSSAMFYDQRGLYVGPKITALT